MDPGRARLPNLGESHSGRKDCRDRAMPNSAPAVVDKNSNSDPLCRPEWDGSHRAPVGRWVKAPRRRMRPAGDSGSARRVTPARGHDAMRRSAVRPLSQRRWSSLWHWRQNRMYHLDGRPSLAEPAESSRR